MLQPAVYERKIDRIFQMKEALRGMATKAADRVARVSAGLLSKVESKRKDIRLRGRDAWYWHLLEQAEIAAEGLKAVEDFTVKPARSPATQFREIKKRAQANEKLLIAAVDRISASSSSKGAAPTPNDLLNLSYRIDDILDGAKSAVEKIVLYGVSPEKTIKEIARCQHLGVRDVVAALQDFKSRPRRAMDRVVGAQKAFAEAGRLAVEAKTRLYQNPSPIVVMKIDTVYRHFSDAADCGAQAAGMIGDLLVKMR